ncbi:bifunctional acetate--CoA ligase family protein/GNAT family N-acetyltransferase [Gordonia hydrophobica]|uniref:GNAT family N-acetyltransferase n=1 Tax=Gordonia hydrophobica TaxID=40516 RepID=A0ABZ2U0P6_9ACTN|nr:bifunctional GNAT family N-acetyltransferase/acetate--CoA ligase family protein [Gordonia hydrophobica]MBM7367704.1 acyl-CoA synthetase (NDP forming)/GNAT superfamily N-acetyltransferase [Gordonia hydrophobica]
MTENPTADSTPAANPTAESTSTEPALPREYPRQWSADVLASDGGVVHIRPILPADADLLVAFHNGLSERTRYMRYFGPTPTLPPREVVRMTTVDYRNRVALLAFLGDEVIAMGLYEGLAADGKPHSAEVAFVVADDHQGRGLGPVLLEHLAGAAAENHFTRFEAEVLSENPNMVAVFRDAGYQISRAFDGSTVHVEFLIDPTEALTSVRNARERASEARSVANLLRPQSVAVIGASTDSKKVGNVLLANILAAGFTGPVFPVNGPVVDAPEPDHAATNRTRTPHAKQRVAPPSVRGIRAYSTVRDIPDPVDLAVIAVPAARIDQVLDDCLAKGVRTLVIVSAGFGERGSAGLENEKRLAEQVRQHGMRLVGPNALGVVNNHREIALNASLAPRIPGAGRVGFFCQSGALGIAILDTAAHRQIGLSTFVSAGNRADVSGNDVLQYWDTDDDTDVVLLYLESFGNPRKFGRIARRVATKKPIVAIKSGSGAMSPVHAQRTGPVRDDRVAQMVLEQAGVIQVETIAELFDCATVLAYQQLPAGPRTAIVGNSSVIASLAGNTARTSGLDVVSSVDLGPAVTHEELTAAVAAAMGDDTIDAVIVVFVPPVAVDSSDYALGLMEATRPADGGDVPVKPVVTTFLAVEGVPEGLSRTGADGLPIRGSIPSYPTPERAASALAQAWRYAKWRTRPALQPAAIANAQPEDARSFVREAMSDGADRTLTAGEGAYVLAQYGIDVVPFRDVSSMHEASAAARELGFPVVVKSTSPGWVGRVDREGARLDLSDATAVITAFNELQALTGSSALQVQRMAAKGVGLCIGVTDSPSFGPLISFGLSGRLFEALGDRSYRSIPLTEHDARELVDEPSVQVLLAEDGTDPARLVDLLQRVSALIDDVPEIRELYLDPILTSPDGIAVLGSQIKVGPVPTLADTGPRRLG